MRSDSRLSVVLHLLLHLAESENPRTSEELARSLETHPVVVRRLLGGLRDSGLVGADKGHGGGWKLARPLSSVSLGDVYRALGSPRLFALGNRSENPECLVEKAVNAALGGTLEEAQALLLSRFDQFRLGDLAREFHAKWQERKSHGH